MLEIKDLVVKFRTMDGTVNAVNGVGLTVEKGKTLGLVGETGAGKTTTALSILRLLQTPPGEIVSGEILYNGEDLLKKTDAEMRAIRGKTISMIFQDPMTALNPVIRVIDQITECVMSHDKCNRAEALIKAADVLELVGIPASRGNEYPHQFSGGMKQRVVIAMALACTPELLIADEPTTALDVTIQAQVLSTIRELKTKLNTSMILITHDLGVVAENCDTVAIMYAGEIVESGSLAQVFKDMRHPYTLGLFGSIPSLDKIVKRLTPIAGLMPDPTNLPKGCYFDPRCPRACTECSKGHPELYEVEPGHFVRCFLERGGEGA